MPKIGVPVFHHLADHRHGIDAGRRRIAGTVREKDAVRLVPQHLFRRRRRRHHGDAQPASARQRRMLRLAPKSTATTRNRGLTGGRSRWPSCHSVSSQRRSGGRSLPWRGPCLPGPARPWPRRSAPRHRTRRRGAWASTAVRRAAVADAPGQPARIDPAHAGDPWDFCSQPSRCCAARQFDGSVISARDDAAARRRRRRSPGPRGWRRHCRYGER